MLIKPQQLSMLVGPTSSGKTFLAVDLACSVAKGLPWMGWNVLSGSTVYVTNEEASFRRRVDAWKAYNELNITDLYTVNAHGLDLAENPAGILKSRICWFMREPIDFVVLDTFNTMIGNSTSAEGMYRALEQINCLIEATGAHVMLVCNETKHLPPRGRPLLGSAVDLILGANDRTVMILKQATQPEALPRKFALTPVVTEIGGPGEERDVTCVATLA